LARFFKYLFLFSFILLLFGCKAFEGKTYFSGDPLTEDIKMGESMKNEILTNSTEFPVDKDSKLNKYLQSIIDEILKSPEIKNKTVFKYNITVLDRTDVINAFSLPGGNLFIYKGMLRFIDDEATLAAVIAHEIAHSELRHTYFRVRSQEGFGNLIDKAFKKDEYKAAKTAANIAKNLSFLSNSRDNELEADKNALNYLKSTKWYPAAMLTFFDKISALVSQSGNQLDGLLSTHPLAKDRIDALKELSIKMKILPPNEDNLNYYGYQDKLVEFGLINQ